MNCIDEPCRYALIRNQTSQEAVAEPLPKEPWHVGAIWSDAFNSLSGGSCHILARVQICIDTHNLLAGVLGNFKLLQRLTEKISEVEALERNLDFRMMLDLKATPLRRLHEGGTGRRWGGQVGTHLANAVIRQCTILM